MGTTKNIVLTGFMGTGKTTVGRLIAHQLHRPFVDMDAEIESSASMSISEIFEQRGEQIFRQWESRLCRDLAQREGLVISTGGGALISEVNRRVMLESGLVVCLNASSAAIEERLSALEREGRPLAAQWQELLVARQPIYALMPYQVDTTDKSPEAVASEIIGLWTQHESV